VIDFGLTKHYRSDATGEVLPERRPDPTKFRGTTSFASVHAFEGKDLSRRDDLWSLLYILIELYTGTLPWRTESAAPRNQDEKDLKKEKVLSQKKACMRDFTKYFEARGEGTAAASCELRPKGHPALRHLESFQEHLKTLAFGDAPDYEKHLRQFQNASEGLVRVDQKTGQPELRLPKPVCEELAREIRQFNLEKEALVGGSATRRPTPPLHSHHHQPPPPPNSSGKAKSGTASFSGRGMAVGRGMGTGMGGSSGNLHRMGVAMGMGNAPQPQRGRDGALAGSGGSGAGSEARRYSLISEAEMERDRKAAVKRQEALQQQEESLRGDGRSKAALNEWKHFVETSKPAETLLGLQWYIKNGIQKHHGKTAARRVLLTLAEDIVAELGHNARR